MLKSIHKKSMSVVILTMISSNLLAEDSWLNAYGKINLTLDKVSEDNGDNFWRVESNASRFGLKGKGAAGAYEAFYQLEWEVDLADEGKEKNIKSRNQIVGIRGEFGEVFLGRHDTPTKKLQKKIDLFGDLIGDIKHSFNAEKRASNIMQYSSPKSNGFVFKAALVPGEETDTNDGLADGTSIAVEYKKDHFGVGLSQDTDIEGMGVDTTRLVSYYTMGDWKFGAMYQNTTNNGEEGDGFMVSAKYSMGDNAFKIQVIESDVYQAYVSSKVKYTSQQSIGWDHKLGKKMTAYTYFTQGEQGLTADKDTQFGLGLVLKF